MDKIKEVLDCIEELPPAPEVLPHLLRELDRYDSDVNRVVDLITVDPALTSKLLQTSNCAYYSPSQRISKVSEAVQRLGFHAVYTIVAVASAGQFLKPEKPVGGIDPTKMWRHSVTTAFASQFLADDLGEDTDVLFTAGLLHDLGKIILAFAFKDDYASLCKAAGGSGSMLVELEQAQFGWSHAEIGAQAMERWSFPPPLVASVRFHHDPSGAKEDARAAGCVSLGNALARSLEKGPSAVFSGPSDALKSLDLNSKDLSRYGEQISENMEFVEAMCRL